MSEARVVGAGLSGLATAWHLVEHGFAVTVRERSSRPGGLISTRQTPHGLVETAANAFVWTPLVQEWFSRLNLTPTFPRRESRRRYIFRNQAPRRWPLTLPESAVMFGRLTYGAMTRSLSGREHETIAAWGDRVIGRAARTWLLEPAMQGIYAGSATELSAHAVFSRRRRRRARLVAPAEGMGMFVSRLYDRLQERGVRFEFGREAHTLDRDVPTAICTDVACAARLLWPIAPRVAADLARVRVAALATVTMFFPPDADDTHGFGVLFPRATGVRALGVLFNADIFTGRGDVRSETWIVGDHAGAVTDWSDAELQAALLDDRRRLTQRWTDPLSVHITRWPRAIPIYDEAILPIAPSLATLPPWIAVAGNYVGRIGVADLLETGARAAARLTRITPVRTELAARA